MLGKETDSYMEKHIYDLILELNRISKTILLSVLPQLEFKLKVRCYNFLCGTIFDDFLYDPDCSESSRFSSLFILKSSRSPDKLQY